MWNMCSHHKQNYGNILYLDNVVHKHASCSSTWACCISSCQHAAVELQKGRYYQGNFEGSDCHLDNMKKLEHCVVTVIKCQWKRSGYVINSVHSDKSKLQRLLVAFKCHSIWEQVRGRYDFFKDGRFQTDNSKTLPETVCLFRLPEWTKHSEMLLHNGFKTKLWRVSYSRIKRGLAAGGEKCWFHLFTRDSFFHMRRRHLSY